MRVWCYKGDAMKSIIAMLLLTATLITATPAQKAFSGDANFFADAHPGAPEFYFGRGYKQQRLGNYDQTIAEYTEALNLNSGHAKSHTESHTTKKGLQPDRLKPL